MNSPNTADTNESKEFLKRNCSVK